MSASRTVSTPAYVRGVALTTFKEILRSRVLAVQLLYVFIAASSAWLFSHFQSDYALERRMATEVGLAGMGLLLTLMSVFLGMVTIQKDLDEKTAYPLLVMPVRRWSYLLGKVLGVGMALSLNTALMAMVLQVMLALRFHSWHPGLVAVCLATMVKMTLLASLVVFFSLSRSATITVSLSVLFYVLGSMTDSILHMAEHSGKPLFGRAISLLYWLIPNFAYLDCDAFVTRGLPVDWKFTAYGIGYGLGYIVLVVFVASLLFERMDV